ncbi:MAG: B12-binding domain-containing radical SAM protein [Parcubacteria group bacterium]|jgi:hypothetical protein
MKRVFLINVGDRRPADSLHWHAWPSLGILTVGSLLQEIGWDVTLYDENILGPIRLEDFVRSGDVVGLSLLISSCERGLHLANEAKKLGSQYVILGNDQAASRAKQILSQCPSVDGIFLGDNLDPIEKVFGCIAKISSLPVDGIAGFTRRDRNGIPALILAKPFHSLQFNKPDFKLYSQAYWERVWQNHQELDGSEYSIDSTGIKNATIMLASGCAHGRNACSYCSINEVGQMRWGDADYFLSLIEAYKNFGISTYYNVTDDFTGFPQLIDKLYTAGVKFPNLIFYGRARSAMHRPKIFENILRLVDGGYAKVNCGLDSGSDLILQQGLNKGHGIRENKELVLLAKKLGLHLHCSFIFGSPGENERSCQETLEFIEWMLGILGKQVARIESDIFWAWHSAPSGRIFTSYEFARGYAAMVGKDLPRVAWRREFNIYQDSISLPWKVQLSFLRWFTRVDVDFVRDCNTNIRRLAEKYGVIYGIAHGANANVIK